MRRVMTAVLCIAVIAAVSFCIVVGGQSLKKRKDGHNIPYSVMWENRQYTELIAKGNAVLDKNPMDHTALVYTGFANFYEGISRLNLEDKISYIDQTVFLLRRALLTGSKESASIKYILGKAYYHKGHYYSNLTVKYLSEAIKEGYSSSDIFEYLGLAYADLGDYTSSIENYHKAIDSGSASDQIYVALAYTYLDAGMPDKAEEYLSFILSKTEDKEIKGKSYPVLARLYFDRKDYDNAELCYRQYLVVNPQSADTYYLLGEIYELRGDKATARNLWKRALNLNPNHYKARLKVYG
ncbi:MAG: tetratricopeptide repeat protein [Spirochaetia bacterium]|nr:tetratricopeptide repeat protein [Spirochaetia bacterium]